VRDVGGEEVLGRVNEGVLKERGHAMRVIDDHVVRPSQDLGVIAGEALRGIGGPRPSTALRVLMRALDLGDAPFESDLLSYLFFDRAFTRRLVSLGYEDAQRQSDELAEFFSD
jgi:NTE family protein